MQLCIYLLNFAWSEAILKKKHSRKQSSGFLGWGGGLPGWIASKLTESVYTQKPGAHFSAPAQSQHHALIVGWVLD